MKRYLAVFFALCGILSFVSCGDRLEKETEWGATEYFKDLSLMSYIQRILRAIK